MDLLELVREMLFLAVTLALPVAAAAMLGGIIGGLLVALVGLQDEVVAAMIRAVAVVLSLAVAGPTLAHHVRDFTAATWADLGELGRERHHG